MDDEILTPDDLTALEETNSIVSGQIDPEIGAWATTGISHSFLQLMPGEIRVSPSEDANRLVLQIAGLANGALGNDT